MRSGFGKKLSRIRILGSKQLRIRTLPADRSYIALRPFDTFVLSSVFANPDPRGSKFCVEVTNPHSECGSGSRRHLRTLLFTASISLLDALPYATRRKRRYEANKCGWTQPLFCKALDRGVN